MSATPNPVPNPEPNPHSVLLRITSPCSIFVPMLFCPNPCPFPSTLLCSFQYLYIDSFLYVPQSEIDIDCPLWTSVHLIRTFRIHRNLRPSKLRTRECREVKHQSLSRVLVKHYRRPSSLVVPESFGLPCSVSVCLWIVSVFNRFGGSDDEFEGQSMLISDWGTYMRFGTYKYWRESCQGSRNRAYIRVGVRGTEIEQGELKCEVKRKHETKQSSQTWNVMGNRIQGQMSKRNNCDDGWNGWLDSPKSYSP